MNMVKKNKQEHSIKNTNFKKYFLTIALSVFSVCLLSGKTYASGNAVSEGQPGKHGGSCANGTEDKYFDTCYGFTWRKYMYTSGDVKFKGSGPNGSGPNYTVHAKECGDIGADGFYFLGWEVYDPSGKGGVGRSLGFQKSLVSLGQVNNIPYYTKRDTSKAGVESTESNDKHLAGSPVSWATAESEYNKAKNKTNKSPSGTWADFNSSSNSTTWFCYSESTTPVTPTPTPVTPSNPESAEFQARSTVNVDGHTAAVGYSSSSQSGVASTTRTYEDKGKDITISFTHDLKKVGSASKTSAYTISFDGSSVKSGSTGSSDSYSYNKTVSIPNAGNTAKYCSKLVFDNGKGGTNTKSEVCANIVVGNEEFNVTFTGWNEIYADGTITALEDPGVSGAVDNGDGTFTIPSGTAVSGGDIKVLEENVPLRFKNWIKRTDSSNVSQAGTIFAVTNPGANTEFDVTSGISFDSLKSAARTALDDVFAYHKDSGSWFEVDLLGLSRLTAGEEKMVHEGHANITATPTEEGNKVCQIIAYASSRLVDENGNSVTAQSAWELLKKSVSFGFNCLKYLFQQIQGGNDDPDQSAQADCAAAAKESFDAAKDLVKNIWQNIKGTIGQVLTDQNLPFSYSCVTVKQALNFQLRPSMDVDQDMAIVGESLSINTNNSKIRSERENPDMPLTKTSPLEIQTIVFLSDVSHGDISQYNGNITSSEDPCTYFNPVIYGEIDPATHTTCKTITEFSTTGKVIDNGGNQDVVDASFNTLFPSTTYSYTVPDLELNQMVCFAIGAKDANSTSYNQKQHLWAISGATCRTVAKKPSLSITGGSVYSGDEIITSITNKGSKVFGSWVEYGAVAKGQIHYNGNKGFASGNVFSNGAISGNSALDNNPLTITNNDSTKLGSYTSNNNPVNEKLWNRIMTTFAEPAKDPANPSRDTDQPGYCDGICYHALSSVDPSTAISGSHIIYNNGDIEINKNIEYIDNVGPNKIPQVIIISENGRIRIKEDVTRVDAWLIAYDYIQTCGDNQVGTLKASDCGNELKINGPVITRNPMNTNEFNRTYGSGTGANSATPAENFNLPASTYAWTYIIAKQLADTYYQAYITELAPRY